MEKPTFTVNKRDASTTKIIRPDVVAKPEKLTIVTSKEKTDVNATINTP